MTKLKYDFFMPLVVPRFIIMTATCVFVSCSAIVMDVEMPLLKNYMNILPNSIILLTCSRKQSHRLVKIKYMG